MPRVREPGIDRDERSGAPELRVVTYNIHKGFSAGNTRFVLHSMRKALTETAVDLIFLQEIQGEHAYRERFIDDWPDMPQLQFLAGGIWPHQAYGKNAIYDAGHHGNAILSKHPIVSWENINVSGSRLASRSVLHGVIEPPEAVAPVHVICIHFGLSAVERRRQIEVLCERIRSHVPKNAPLILAGDFNDWTGRAGRRVHDDLGLADVFVTLTRRPARTYPAWLPLLPVDRIFYRGARPTACRCLSGEPWRRLSDHAALYASFALDVSTSAGERPLKQAEARPARRARRA